MSITKDAEWNRLEGRVGQLRGDLEDATKRYKAYAASQVAKQLGLERGKTVILYNNSRYLFRRIEWTCWEELIISPFKKDGTPSNKEQRVYGQWTKEAL